MNKITSPTKNIVCLFVKETNEFIMEYVNNKNIFETEFILQ